MKKMNVCRWLLVYGACVMLGVSAMAQGYYDDDIYFDAEKAKKETKKVRTSSTAIIEEYAGSDRNVDEYNRRGDYAPVAETATDLGDNLEYTRRIERFHNPDIVVKSGDDDLLYYYDFANDELADVNGYTSPTTINIYVDNTDPWDLYWSPYYYSSAWSWAWRRSYYNPWWTYNYTWGYGPSLSWSWTWGPSWSWNWHWGPSWDWHWGWHSGCGWIPPHHHHGPAWNDHHHHRPIHWAGSGASGTPGRPGYSGNDRGRRPSGTYPRVDNSSSGRRPVGGTVANGESAGRRPSGSAASASGSVGRPGGVYNPSNSSRPGRTEATVTGRGGIRRGNASDSGSRSSYNSGRTSSRSSSATGSRSSYNSGRSSSSRSSISSGRSSSGGSRSSVGTSSRSGGGSSRSGGGGRSSGGRH